MFGILGGAKADLNQAEDRRVLASFGPAILKINSNGEGKETQ
jgi:hypothetical protein